MPSPAESESGPDPESLLRSIAAAAPGLWFPQQYADALGLPRAALTEPVWLLRQAGLVEVGDWVKGLGQGLRLSTDGEKAVAAPAPLAVRPSSTATPVRADEPTELVRGDAARNALLDPPPAVLAPSLLYANVAWFVVGCIIAWRGGVATEFLQGKVNTEAGEALMRSGAQMATAVWNGDWWRLATSCFVHIGLFHLLMNMLMLGMMGPFAEGLWGRWRFAAIYAVAGVCGSMAAVALHPLARTGAEVLSAGASGALWGMMAGVVVWVIRARRHLPPDLIREWGRRLTFLVLMNVAISFAPGISAEAHFGGGIAGAAVAWSVAVGHRRRRLWAIGGITLVLAAFILMLVATVQWSDDWQQVKQRELIRKILEEAVRLQEAEQPERAAVRAAVGDDWKKMSPKEVTGLRGRYAAIHQDHINSQAKVQGKLRKSVEELRGAATAAAARLPAGGDLTERYRAYFQAVAGYATALGNELDRPGRQQTPELDAAFQAYSVAWQRVGWWE